MSISRQETEFVPRHPGLSLAHVIDRDRWLSVPRSAAQKRGRVSDTTAAAPPSSVMNCNLQPRAHDTVAGSSSSKEARGAEISASLHPFSLPQVSPTRKELLTTAIQRAL